MSRPKILVFSQSVPTRRRFRHETFTRDSRGGTKREKVRLLTIHGASKKKSCLHGRLHALLPQIQRKETCVAWPRILRIRESFLARIWRGVRRTDSLLSRRVTARHKKILGKFTRDDNTHRRDSFDIRHVEHAAPAGQWCKTFVRISAAVTCLLR